MAEKKPITINEILKKKTTIIEIENFAGDGLMAVEVKRPSIMNIAQTGSIPNELMGMVKELFIGKGLEELDPDKFEVGRIREIFEPIAKASLVNPSYKDLEDNDIELTDVQLSEIYNFVAGGVKELENFRKIKELYKDAMLGTIQQTVDKFTVKNQG